MSSVVVVVVLFICIVVAPRSLIHRPGPPCGRRFTAPKSLPCKFKPTGGYRQTDERVKANNETFLTDGKQSRFVWASWQRKVLKRTVVTL